MIRAIMRRLRPRLSVRVGPFRVSEGRGGPYVSMAPRRLRRKGRRHDRLPTRGR